MKVIFLHGASNVYYIIPSGYVTILITYLVLRIIHQELLKYVRAIIEECRSKCLGGLGVGLAIYEIAYIRALLNNAQTWMEIDSKTIEKLEENIAGKSCIHPSGGTISTTWIFFKQEQCSNSTAP